MKKFLIILLSIVLIGGLIKYKYDYNKCKDINYVVQKYFTTGIFNNYKMCSISKVNLSFSNGSTAVINVDGMEDKSPHKKVAYNVFLEKNTKGIWKVTNVYVSKPNLNLEQ